MLELEPELIKTILLFCFLLTPPTSQTANLKKSPIAPIIIRVYYFL